MGRIEGDFDRRDGCPFVPGQKKSLSRCLLCPGTIKGSLSLCPPGQENPVPLETLLQNNPKKNVTCLNPLANLPFLQFYFYSIYNNLH